MKKLIAMLAVLVLLTGVLAVPAFAADSPAIIVPTVPEETTPVAPIEEIEIVTPSGETATLIVTTDEGAMYGEIPAVVVTESDKLLDPENTSEEAKLASQEIDAFVDGSMAEEIASGENVTVSDAAQKKLDEKPLTEENYDVVGVIHTVPNDVAVELGVKALTITIPLEGVTNIEPGTTSLATIRLEDGSLVVVEVTYILVDGVLCAQYSGPFGYVTLYKAK